MIFYLLAIISMFHSHEGDKWHTYTSTVLTLTDIMFDKAIISLINVCITWFHKNLVHGSFQITRLSTGSLPITWISSLTIITWISSLTIRVLSSPRDDCRVVNDFFEDNPSCIDRTSSRTDFSIVACRINHSTNILLTDLVTKVHYRFLYLPGVLL